MKCIEEQMFDEGDYKTEQKDESEKTLTEIIK